MSKFIKLGFGQGFIDLNTLTIIDYYNQYAEDTAMQESKPEKANVFLTKIIHEYETLVVNTVDYNDDLEQMYLDAIMLEVHNHDENDRDTVFEELKESDFEYFNDGWEITLVINQIEPFTEKQLDKDMYLTIKYPAI